MDENKLDRNMFYILGKIQLLGKILVIIYKFNINSNFLNSRDFNKRVLYLGTEVAVVDVRSIFDYLYIHASNLMVLDTRGCIEKTQIQLRDL